MTKDCENEVIVEEVVVETCEPSACACCSCGCGSNDESDED